MATAKSMLGATSMKVIESISLSARNALSFSSANWTSPKTAP